MDSPFWVMRYRHTACPIWYPYMYIPTHTLLGPLFLGFYFPIWIYRLASKVSKANWKLRARARARLQLLLIETAQAARAGTHLCALPRQSIHTVSDRTNWWQRVHRISCGRWDCQGAQLGRKRKWQGQQQQGASGKKDALLINHARLANPN